MLHGMPLNVRDKVNSDSAPVCSLNGITEMYVTDFLITDLLKIETTVRKMDYYFGLDILAYCVRDDVSDDKTISPKNVVAITQ
jgi:hypothetical protein